MTCPPHVLRWIDDLCYWVLLSPDCESCLCQSKVGFPTEADAEANFRWWYAS